MATVKVHKVTIDGVDYGVPTMDAGRALVVLPRLFTLVGDADASAIAGASREQISAALKSPAMLMSIMSSAAKNAADPDGIFKGAGLKAVVRDFLHGVTCERIDTGIKDEEGTPVYESGLVLGTGRHNYFDEHFSGRLMHLGKLVWEVVHLNFFGPSAAKS